MNRRPLMAVTLIELLVVVAMMALLAGGTFAFITLPPREQLYATTDMEHGLGLATFFSTLVADAHNAAALEVAPEYNALLFDQPLVDATTVYFVDPRAGLRRAVRAGAARDLLAAGLTGLDSPTSSTLLARDVAALAAAPSADGARWAVTLSLAPRDPLHPTCERRLEFALGYAPSPAPVASRSKTDATPLAAGGH